MSRDMANIWTEVLRRNAHDMSLEHCIEGLTDLQALRGPCAKVNFEGADEGGLGVTNFNIKHPLNKRSCVNTYGELYVYLACTESCTEAGCPLRSVAQDSCVNIPNKNKVYTLTQVVWLLF